MCASCNYKLHINLHEALQMSQAFEKRFNRPKGLMALKEFPICFISYEVYIIPCSLIMYWQIIGSCYYTLPMTKSICTCLSSQCFLVPITIALISTQYTWWWHMMVGLMLEILAIQEWWWINFVPRLRTQIL